MLPILLALVPLSLLLWYVAHPRLVQRRRDRVAAREFPAAWRRILFRQIPAYRRLPPRLQAELRRHILVFLDEKGFTGCDGQEITDEVRVTIAAHACLLLLNKRARYFPKLRQILVYPSAFVVERLRPEPSGVLQETRHALSGESWTHGQIVLSWDDVLRGSGIPDDGQNVVIHEFAHQLDQEKGFANGAPDLPTRSRYASWSATLMREFATLQQAVAMGEPTLINAYGATNPAEFFAVASEVFFEQPRPMAALHPELYSELSRFYRVDPAGWD